MLKKCKIVMLSTNEPSKIGNLATYQKRSLSKVIKEGVNPKDSTVQFWNLYITSDEEIKEGGWVIANQAPRKCIRIETKNTSCPYITLQDGEEVGHFQTWHNIIIASTDTNLNLPQPSQQFIEKYIESYNKGEIITDVLVEYNCGDSHCSLFGCQKHLGCKNESIQTVKINPKDNTITIKKAKDSWNREEILNDIEQAIIQGLDIGQYRDKWIKENL